MPRVALAERCCARRVAVDILSSTTFVLYLDARALESFSRIFATKQIKAARCAPAGPPSPTRPV